MDFDEMLSAKARGIDPETWEALSRYSRRRMVATDLAERILDNLRQSDYAHDAEQQRKAAADRARRKRRH